MVICHIAYATGLADAERYYITGMLTNVIRYLDSGSVNGFLAAPGNSLDGDRYLDSSSLIFPFPARF
jgi:hypothetical protein